jgi:hypothetical protein
MTNNDRTAEYRDISSWSYNLGQPDVSKHVPLPKGWEEVDSSFIRESEFGAAILKNPVTKEMVVVFRGTDPSKLRDQVTNAALLLPGKKPEEYMMAERYIEKALADMPPDYQMRITGHSQGAGMAHYMGLKHDIPSVGFNTSPGNIYLNNIYDTLPKDGKASHIDLRSSEDGTKGIAGFNSDFISSGETPITNPVAPLVAPLVPDLQAYMDPIAKIEAKYLKTGCKDAICHSLENFADPQLKEAQEHNGGDILPNDSIVGGKDLFNSCFPTRDETDGITLTDARINEAKEELGKAADAVTDAAKAAANKVEEAWDDTTGAISNAWDKTTDAAGDALDWTKDKANDLWDSAFGDDPAPPTFQPWEGMGGRFSGAGGGGSWAPGSGGETIIAMDDQADELANSTDTHANSAESSARRAESAARRAAAIAAQIRAMMSRRYA